MINVTSAVNFQREAAFEHADSKTVVAMPQPNGTIYTFGRDVNILWRHGILQVGVLMCSCSGHHFTKHPQLFKF